MRLAISLLLALAPTAFAEPPVVGPHGEPVKKIAIYTPKPHYPGEARAHRWVGVGWFAMHVDEPTGVVISVDVLQSTGHWVLDQACIDALKKWKFVPRSGLKTVRTPIRFNLKGPYGSEPNPTR